MSRGSNQTRQPSNVTVFPQTRRYGSYPAGYQIINTSLTATIWVADNTSCRPGQGTPVSPGTSLVWNTDGDLFMCLGDDTQSVVAGNAAVVLSYDVGGWQPDPSAVAAQILNSGVLVVDKPVNIISIDASRSPGYDSGRVDVSRYQSLIFKYRALAGGFWQARITFYASSNPLFNDDLATYFVTADPSFTQQGTQTFACVGAYVRLELTLASVPNVVMGMMASNRAVTTDVHTEMTPNTVGGALATFGGLINGGSSFDIVLPPYFGVVQLNAECVTAGAGPTFGAIILYPVSNALRAPNIYEFNNARPYIIYNAGGGIYMKVTDIALWGTTALVRIVNTTANPQTYYLNILPQRYR